MLLKPAQVSYKQFTYDAATATFSAEMSSTHGFGRVYDDAADEGLTVIGRTGLPVVFAVWADHRDAEGDLTHWDLRAVTPGSTNFRMTIWND